MEQNKTKNLRRKMEQKIKIKINIMDNSDFRTITEEDPLNKRFFTFYLQLFNFPNSVFRYYNNNKQ